MKRVVLSFTTNTAGSAVANGEGAILGELVAIDYHPISPNSGSAAGIVVTAEDGTQSHPLLTKTLLGASNLTFYPRDIAHKVADGAQITTNTSGSAVDKPLIAGVPKVVVTSSGSTAGTGAVIIYYRD
jgi:hypothetical protein